MAKNPAIPTKSRDYVNSKKGGCHFVLKCNGIISGSSKTRMHQGGGVVKITYPLEQMDFPLLFEGILTRSPQCQTSLLNLRRKLQYCLVTDFSVTDHDSSFMVFYATFSPKNRWI